tara:strand:- start:334 stop:720 length:387 start_codon:yes stop_codon:yes gene_type:complete
MTDEVLTIMLTEREIDLLHQCLSTNIETVKRRHDVTGSTADLIQELGELSDDLFEQLHRRDDGGGIDAEINAETQMFTAGVEAREKIKATSSSRAQDRRTFNMKRSRDSRLSETQTHDVWDDNDPKNW